MLESVAMCRPACVVLTHVKHLCGRFTTDVHYEIIIISYNRHVFSRHLILSVLKYYGYKKTGIF